VIAALLAGCANEKPLGTNFGPAASLGVAQSGPEAALTPPPFKKTLSDRILAAIALERVTGLKPDPSRFRE
jgi:hypothetical protein